MSKKTTKKQTSPTAKDYEPALQVLQGIEQAVRTSEGTALMARWESGQYLNTLKTGKQHLPPGLRAKLCHSLRVSPAELTARMKFARKYPSDADVANAVSKFGSWHTIVRDGLTDSPKTKNDNEVDDKGRNHTALVRVVDLLENIEPEFLGDGEEPLLTEIVELVKDLRQRKALAAAA